MHIELLRTDVTSLRVDAITNPASASKVVAELGSVPVGHAVVTSGGNVLCKFVIHAIASVAMPPVPAPFGFEPGRCARVLISTALDFRPHARSLHRVVFCAFDEETYGEMRRAREELTP